MMLRYSLLCKHRLKQRYSPSSQCTKGNQFLNHMIRVFNVFYDGISDWISSINGELHAIIFWLEWNPEAQLLTL